MPIFLISSFIQRMTVRFVWFIQVSDRDQSQIEIKADIPETRSWLLISAKFADRSCIPWSILFGSFSETETYLQCCEVLGISLLLWRIGFLACQQSAIMNL